MTTPGDNHDDMSDSGLEIAVIGMAGRFPDAPDIETFWRNLREGAEAVRGFTDAQLRACGVAQSDLDDPRYVKAGVVMEGMDRFDAAFFGYSPREAEQLDPQQRHFLECAWHAMEHAGYDVARLSVAVGVYAGAGANLYLMTRLLPGRAIAGDGISGMLALLNGNAGDALSTRVAYEMDLRGPAVTIQSACSTSLMAVHAACQGLLGHECDMALAGGVWLNLLQDRGYLHQPGAILSSDGHCRAFDSRADGTVLGSGAGVVVLRRLADAQRDGDEIHAVIKASAANNDGADKVGYTAPSIAGQAAVIRSAHLIAGVKPATIGYVEAHGTGTSLGDPVEMAALTQAFGTVPPRQCAIGSVKTNIGHLDAAAGIAGFIKTVLSLKHATLVPSLNFETPNPRIDFASGPFHVNTRTRPWPGNGAPRRAGVSAFGMGGTNVHVVLEEAPVPGTVSTHAFSQAHGRISGEDPGPTHGQSHDQSNKQTTDQSVGTPAEGVVPLVISARDDAALRRQAGQLADYLERHPDIALDDAARTLSEGRKRFPHRAAALAAGREEAIALLRSRDGAGFARGEVLSAQPTVAFLFPGQGAQYAGMTRELYRREAVFRAAVDECCELLHAPMGLDLRELLYPLPRNEETAAAQLNQTACTQPALFVVEYALARLWEQWGVRPDAMLGHSLGEYVAACLAGVFTLQDALMLVAARGRLMQSTAAGAMLAVLADAETLTPRQRAGCDIAAVNGAEACVLAGPHADVERAEAALLADTIVARRLAVSHAFHSALLEPILPRFREIVRGVRLHPPRRPFVSNLTGTWIAPQQACDPEYWVRHMREPVRFAPGLACLLEKEDRILVEVGPGETLCGLARRHADIGTTRPVLGCEPRGMTVESGAEDVLPVHRVLARLWTAGVDVDPFGALRGAQAGRRVGLPGYPFEQQSYWAAVANGVASGASPKPASGTGLYVPLWQRVETLDAAGSVSTPKPLADVTVVVHADAQDWLAARLTERLAAAGAARVMRLCARSDAVSDTASASASASTSTSTSTSLATSAGHTAQEDESRAPLDDAAALRHVLSGMLGSEPGRVRIVFLAALDEEGVTSPEGAARVAKENATGEEPYASGTPRRAYARLVALACALDAMRAADRFEIEVCVVVDGMEGVTGAESLRPDKAMLLGPCLVMPQEIERLSCRILDVAQPPATAWARDRFSDQLHIALRHQEGPRVALRGPYRWVRRYEAVRRDAPDAQRLREGGLYVIAGGHGGVGHALARHLARHWRARLVMLTRQAMPARVDWDASLADVNTAADVRRRIEQARELEVLGAQVRIECADLLDAGGLQQAFARIRAEVGPVHGVIHAAGEHAYARLVDITPAMTERALAVKCRGTLNLARAIGDEPPDFLMLCASLAGVAGGVGRADYAAANAWQDAWAAAAQHALSYPVYAIAWDAWRGVGMAAGTRLADGMGIAPEQGGGLMERIVQGPAVAQTVVCARPLNERLGAWNATALAAAAGSDAGSPTIRRGRPSLSTAYAAPQDPLAEGLAALWGELLGLEPIGLDDNFFELGGDSLQGVQLLARVRARYGVELHPAALFRLPTIRALAEAVEDRLLDEIEQASAAGAS